MGGVVLPSAAGDVAAATSLYERAFVDAFDSFLQCAATRNRRSRRRGAACNNADVCCRYHGGLIHYSYQSWGAAQLPTLVEALEYAEAHCRPKDKKGTASAKLYLMLKHNDFTEAEEATLRAAVPKGSTKFEVVF
jgi:hypothetical protein